MPIKFPITGVVISQGVVFSNLSAPPPERKTEAPPSGDPGKDSSGLKAVG